MSVHRHLTDAFPKTYLIAAADDDTVPIQDSYDLESALKQHGIPHFIERPAHGGHGFGLGSVTDAAGWVERAISFFQEASK